MKSKEKNMYFKFKYFPEIHRYDAIITSVAFFLAAVATAIATVVAVSAFYFNMNLNLYLLFTEIIKKNGK